MLLAGYTGQVVAVRAGRKAWDDSRGVPSVAGPTSGNGTVIGAVKFGATRSLSAVIAQFGGGTTAARVGVFTFLSSVSFLAASVMTLPLAPNTEWQARYQ